ACGAGGALASRAKTGGLGRACGRAGGGCAAQRTHSGGCGYAHFIAGGGSGRLDRAALWLAAPQRAAMRGEARCRRRSEAVARVTRLAGERHTGVVTRIESFVPIMRY